MVIGQQQTGTAAVRYAFTLDEYRELLRRTSLQYDCRGFDVLDGAVQAGDRFCLIRHDVDASPERALEIARIEATMGVQATYTILLTGHFYSVLEPETRDVVREISSLGHHIGLHFDAAWHGIEDEAGLEDAIAWEAAILERAVGVPVRMFSFHNTTPFSMSCWAPRYADLWNAYSGVLQKEVTYVSDSNGCWRFHSWDDVLKEHPPRLQVLTHPEWWIPEHASPAQKICAQIDFRAQRAWAYYCDLLIRSERENLADVPRATHLLPHHPIGADVLRHWLSGHRRAALSELVILVRDAVNSLADVTAPEMRAEALEAAGIDSRRYAALERVQQRLMSGKTVYPASELAAAFDDLAVMLHRLSSNADGAPA